MKISRTPLRISFFGGGTDYPQWYNEHGGVVLGTSINKYCYVMLHDGKSWFTFDLPTKAGLGSSSAYTVGLLRVCTELDKLMIAKLATTWEQDKTGGNVGSQDQYLCSVGGFHELRFSEWTIKDSVISLDKVRPLEEWLMLFDTHIYRRGSRIISHQLARLKHNTKLLERIGSIAEEGIVALEENEYTHFGELLHESWSLKKQLSRDVSNSFIDEIYQAALTAGAKGGKLLGGGGGGFMLFVVPVDRQPNVREALDKLSYEPFSFEDRGSEVIYDDNGSCKSEQSS